MDTFDGGSERHNSGTWFSWMFLCACLEIKGILSMRLRWSLCICRKCQPQINSERLESVKLLTSSECVEHKHRWLLHMSANSVRCFIIQYVNRICEYAAADDGSFIFSLHKLLPPTGVNDIQFKNANVGFAKILVTWQQNLYLENKLFQVLDMDRLTISVSSCLPSS